MSEVRHLVVDGGRSKTRARARYADGSVREAGGPGMPIITQPGGTEVVGQQLAALVRELGAKEAETLVFAINGVHVPDPGIEATVIGLARGIVPAARVVIASDMVTSYAGALGIRPGVVLAAGTGAIAMAVDETLDARRVDGWGPYAGDRGSGYALGRAALDVVYRTADGAGDAPALTAAWTDLHGSLDDGAARIYSTGNPVGVVAAFAKPVLGLAARGDSIATALVDAQVRALADTIALASQHAGPAVPVSMTGGMARNDYLRDRLIAALPAGLEWCPARGDALDGAELLAQAGRPVFTTVSAWHEAPR